MVTNGYQWNVRSEVVIDKIIKIKNPEKSTTNTQQPKFRVISAYLGCGGLGFS